jgi:uncharacterized membrane protein YczE
MKKRVFFTELAYVIGVLVLAVGTAVMEKSDLGVSMVVAPAYILHLKLSEFIPFFSFGMAEYILQAFLVVLVVIFMKKVKFSFFFSFVTAVFYGLVLDGVISLLSLFSIEGLVLRIVFFIVGMCLSSMGVALLFNTYISPEAYDLFVKELSAKYKIKLHKFKTAYDCASCIFSIILSFAFFGLWHFEGIGVGTVVCALLNGTLIKAFSTLYLRVWEFKDGLPLKKYF